MQRILPTKSRTRSRPRTTWRQWRSPFVALVVALLCLGGAPLRSQQQAPSSQPQAPTTQQQASTSQPQAPPISVDVKMVSMLASVRDKHGQLISTLTKDDFTVEQDGHAQTITYFAKESDLPLTLGLLVDTSMSQRRVLDQERAASHDFLDQVLREDKDKAFVIHFDYQVELLQDLTSSRKNLDAALKELGEPEFSQASNSGGSGSSGSGGSGGGRGSHGHGGGGTLLYDAIYLASNELMQKQQGRKAIIVLTDGVDRGSRESLTTAIESAQRADTLVYSIYFTGEEGGGFGRPGGFGGPRMGGGPMGGGRGRFPQE